MSNLYRIASGDTLLSRTIGEVAVASLVGMFGKRTPETISEFLTEWAGKPVTVEDVMPALAMLKEDGWLKDHEDSSCGYVLTRPGRRLVASYIKLFVQLIERDSGIISDEMRRNMVFLFDELNPDPEWVDWFVRATSRDGKTQLERDEEKRHDD